MKPKSTPLETANIQRAKAMLRHLWKSSGVKQAEVLKHLSTLGFEIKKSTFSMWLSDKTDNYVRPQAECVKPMLELFCAESHEPEQIEEIYEELQILLNNSGVMSTQALQNKIQFELDDDTLQFHQTQLEGHLPRLEALLREIEDHVFQYDKGYPVIRVEQSEKKLLKALLGKDKALWESYASDDGYEVPLTQVRSLDSLTEVINHLNEGIRLLRAYVEASLLEQGGLGYGYPRVEDFLNYTWEISDRLLNNNQVCKSVPRLKKTLLTLMATCQGIIYLVKNQYMSQSEVAFHNVLKLKGKDSQADVDCSVAVFMGTLARQLLRHGNPEKRQKGMGIFKRAKSLLEKSAPKLEDEEAQFFYTKELGNLCYDIASLMLWNPKEFRNFEADFESLMKGSHEAYKQVLQTSNLFYQGLTESRAMHLRVFYLLSFCWVTPKLKYGVEEINKLNAGQTLNEMFWLVKIAQAIAYAILHRRETGENKARFLKAAQDFLTQARMVPGFEAQTQAEIESDFMLRSVA